MLDQNIAWFVKYAPKTIDEFIFDNDADKALVQNWLANEKIDGNILLYGPPGTGKTTLANILINAIVKSPNDLYRMQERSVKEIDEKIKPFIVKKPVKSKQKIVYIEEMDKLSAQAQVALKEDKLEKYQNIVSFVCCTNYINKIDVALQTRFTYKFGFSNSNIEAIFNRLKTILDTENAQYSLEKLKEFIENNSKLGIRDLINILQLDYIRNNKQILFNISGTDITFENQIVGLINNILNKLLSSPNQIRVCTKTPANSMIAEDWNQLVLILHNNPTINYDYIFEEMYKNTAFLPLQIIIAKYAETYENKKFPHIHLITCVHDMMKCLADLI